MLLEWLKQLRIYQCDFDAKPLVELYGLDDRAQKFLVVAEYDDLFYTIGFGVAAFDVL
jgi:hypothetical protein